MSSQAESNWVYRSAYLELTEPSRTSESIFNIKKNLFGTEDIEQTISTRVSCSKIFTILKYFYTH